MTERQILNEAHKYLKYHLPGSIKYSESASQTLRLCLMRSYATVDEGEYFDIRYDPNSPFYDAMVGLDTNVVDYELPQKDWYEYFETWRDYGSLPRFTDDSYAIAVYYPVARDDYRETKGLYAFATAYWNSNDVKIPRMHWKAPKHQLDTSDLQYSDFYLEGKERYESHLRNPDDYHRNRLMPYLIGQWKDRRKMGIPLTKWQQRCIEVNGYPDLAPPTIAPDVPPIKTYSDLIVKIQGYASEVHHGTLHVERWKRVLTALGATQPGYSPMTADEAVTYLNRGWERWREPLKALREIEAK